MYKLQLNKFCRSEIVPIAVSFRSGSTKLNSLDRCIIGVFSPGKGAGAGDFDEQNLWAA